MESCSSSPHRPRFFFRQNHHAGQYLGNDPEEGFRGAMLNLMAISKMLMLKGALLYDGKKLTGADPRVAKPGAVYFPHRVGVRMRLVGDLPPRPEEFYVEDASSQLFDQASLLWALSEYYHFADSSQKSNWNKVFGKRPGFDGSVMEQKYIVLAAPTLPARQHRTSPMKSRVYRCLACQRMRVHNVFA